MKENGAFQESHCLESLDFDALVNTVDEELKRLSRVVHLDMNERIIEKFDQMRNYYKVSYSILFIETK